MNRIGLGMLLLGAISLGLVGCKHSLVAETWGDAQRENVARMIANPEAGQVRPDEPGGIDATTADGVMGSHRKEQQAPARQTLPSFGEFQVGGGGGGGR